MSLQDDGKGAAQYVDWVKNQMGLDKRKKPASELGTITRQRCGTIAGQEVCVEDKMKLPIVPIVLVLAAVYFIAR